jgi:hypothetical protein
MSLCACCEAKRGRKAPHVGREGKKRKVVGVDRIAEGESKAKRG